MYEILHGLKNSVAIIARNGKTASATQDRKNWPIDERESEIFGGRWWSGKQQDYDTDEVRPQQCHTDLMIQHRVTQVSCKY